MATARVAAARLSDAPSAAPVAARERLYRRSLAYSDAVAAITALFLAVNVLGEDSLRPASLLTVPLVVVASKLMGLYDRDGVVLNKTTLEDSSAVFQLATLFTLVTWLLQGVMVDGHLGREQVLGLWGLLYVTALTARCIARDVARRRSAVERCLIAGASPAADRIRRGLMQTPRAKAEIVAQMRLDGDARRHGEQMRRLEETIRHENIHRVILAPDATDSEEFLETISVIKSLGVRASILPRLFEVVGTSVEFDTLNGLTVLGIRRLGLVRSSRAVKRAMDLLGAGIALIVIGPLMVAIAIAIRVDSRGPVFFRQTRVGREGRRFTMLKFRTMVDGADGMKEQLADRNEAIGLFKISEDPRITSVGHWLRRTSLDELPQLLNVLRGEMSLVGPRPLVIEEDCRIQGRHRRRLQLTPGMTGDWQILGSARIPLDEMVKIDYLYVANWSFWGDVKILARTMLYVLSARGM
jgi:exopolysaccharide biosynthesis polyprenyl glycosylphosphotransferase